MKVSTVIRGVRQKLSSPHAPQQSLVKAYASRTSCATQQPSRATFSLGEWRRFTQAAAPVGGGRPLPFEPGERLLSTSSTTPAASTVAYTLVDHLRIYTICGVHSIVVVNNRVCAYGAALSIFLRCSEDRGDRTPGGGEREGGEGGGRGRGEREGGEGGEGVAGAEVRQCCISMCIYCSDDCTSHHYSDS